MSRQELKWSSRFSPLRAVGLACLSAGLLLTFIAAGRADDADDPAGGETIKGGESPAPAKKGGQGDKKAGRPRNVVGALPPFTPESEAAALKFVGDNHPELSALLQRLKANAPEEYRRAVRELFRTSEKLAQTKTTDAERYELELEDWKIDSEIRLLAAKLAVADDKELHGKLRNQLVRKNKLQLSRLELDKRRAEQRVKRLEANIERLKKEQEQVADRQMNELLNTVRKDRPKRKADKFGVEKSNVEKDNSDRAAADKSPRSEKVEPAPSAGAPE